MLTNAKALKNMKNNKGPGLYRFTVEFFKFFWVDIDALFYVQLIVAIEMGL